MSVSFKLVLGILVGAIMSPTKAGESFILRDHQSVQWEADVQTVRGGNGVFLSPTEELLVSTSMLGYVNGFRPRDGSEVFAYDYVPNSTDVEFYTCQSGVAFATKGDLEYLTFSLVAGESSSNARTRVVALSLHGEELWVSDALEGVSVGTPVVSSDGNYVFLAHNSQSGNVGHFTILNGQTGGTFMSQQNASTPFSPIGIHHNPAEGYFNGGENNRNDVLVWSSYPKPTDTTVGPGAVFGFQFPIGFAGTLDDLEYTLLGNQVREFHTIQKPVIVNQGRTMYWGTSRSQFRCWLGQDDGLDRHKFSRPRSVTLAFSRGDPPMQAVFAPVALSHNMTSLALFGGSASREFVRMKSDCSGFLVTQTTALVKTQAHVSPDDSVVYYVESNGLLHQASAEDLVDRWVVDLAAPVEGEIALTSDGTLLFVAETTGHIRAFRVADVPTHAPSDLPTNTPTMGPSLQPSPTPSVVPTDMPSIKPTAVTPGPSASPSSAATPEGSKHNSDRGELPTMESAATRKDGMVMAVLLLSLSIVRVLAWGV